MSVNTPQFGITPFYGTKRPRIGVAADFDECGVDRTYVDRMCSDRDGWKKCVDEQVRHMNIWKRQKGQNYNWGPIGSKIDRIETRLIYLVSRYERCGKSNFPGKQ